MPCSRRSRALLCTVLLAAAGAAAAEDKAAPPEKGTLEGRLGAASTYVWRGLARSGDAALQGGLTYRHPQGFSASAWASNVAGGSELDLGLAYGGRAGEELRFEVGFTAYFFPQDEARALPKQDFDFQELWGRLRLAPLDLLLAVSPQAGTYLAADATLPEVLGAWALGLHVGSYRTDADFAGLPDDYLDYAASLSRRLDGLTLRFSLWDTDLSGSRPYALVAVERPFSP